MMEEEWKELAQEGLGGDEDALDDLARELEIANYGKTSTDNFPYFMKQKVAYLTKAAEAAKEYVEGESNRILAAYPELESFGWRQYIPTVIYDGPGLIVVERKNLFINGGEVYYDDRPDADTELGKAYIDIVRMLTNIGDEVIEKAFGSSNQLTFSREEGFNSDWYWPPDD